MFAFLCFLNNNNNNNNNNNSFVSNLIIDSMWNVWQWLSLLQLLLQFFDWLANYYVDSFPYN